MDLIERQAAIDEIKNFKNGAEEWRDEQEELSPTWHRADSAFASALEIGLRIKKLPSAPRWIPCKERLPEADDTYIVFAPDYRGGSSSGKEWHGGIMFSKYKNGKWSIEHGYYSRPNCVKAWMPLPEPWKGE